MSSYLNQLHPERHDAYLDIPEDAQEYLHYLDYVKHLSPRTIHGYYLDLRTFFRYLMIYKGAVPQDTTLQEIDPRTITIQDIGAVQKSVIFGYLQYLQAHNNSFAARSRKLTALRGFFHYLLTQVGRIKYDPTEDIDLGSPRKTLPRYLTLEEAQSLLNNTQSDFVERDYCIITLFLNCGMRLVELCGISMSDFRDDTIRIVGKGGKERLVYLNDACLDALRHYLPVRNKLKLTEKDALFISKRTGKRLTPRRVQQIVERSLKAAGLDGRGFSPHKLRHTAATLMYQYGNVDMLALKEILGHENVSTTQIYTHINTKQLKNAVASSPLSGVTYPQKKLREEPEPESEEEDS